MQQQFAAAERALGITLRLEEELVSDADLFGGLVFLEATQALNVVGRVETETYTFSAVTSGTSGLLIVALEALWYVVVYDEPHIGFVDTHTESDGCHNDLHFLHEEGILVGCSCLRIHARVISTRADSVYL